MDLRHWVNDGLMVLFFFIIGLEVRREFAVGELTDRRRIGVPVVAGIGGMAVPALLYLAINPSGEAAAGWGVVIGTDTAFLLGALALVGPSLSTQLRGYAAALGLDVEQFLRDLGDEQLARRVREDAVGAEASGARGTPTFFVGTQRHIGPYDARALTRALEATRATGGTAER